MRADHTLPAIADDRIVPLSVLRPRRRFGDLEVLAPLARGGTSGVYLAAHAATGDRVAIKVLDARLASYPDVVDRLLAEHALASRVSHPSLVDIRAARRTEDGVPYLVMEYLDGETLGQLADRAPLDVATVVAICAQLAAALAALHAVGVIHCDVKHDNVIVLDAPVAAWARGPQVKLIDLGVAHTVGTEPVANAAIAGTPWCMAPEQWSGAPTTGSDVYALGCLLYDLLTGAPPFEGSLPELMIAHLERRPARPSWLRPMPIELERLILRSLAKDPDHRPSMAAVAAALTELADASIVAPAELRHVG